MAVAVAAAAPPARQPGSARARPELPPLAAAGSRSPLGRGDRWLSAGVWQPPRRGRGQQPRCGDSPWPGAGPALRRRTAGSGARLGFPAKAFCLFAETASNFLSKLLIRYTVLSWCFAQGNESGRLEGLVTQGVVIGELRITSALLVQLGCTCDS